MSTHSVIATHEQIAGFLSPDLSKVDYLPRRHDVVISLTTVPSRLETLKLVLHHLMRQTVGELPIELHIARNGRSPDKGWKEVPAWLTSLSAVRVVFHESDPGPALKYLPALAADSSRLVIVVDDDVLYPEDLAARLIAADARWHGEAAVCLRGWKIHHPPLSWDRSVLSEPHPDADVRVAIICGHGGYCLRAPQVDLAALADMQAAPEDSWMMDDIWISGHLSRAGTVKLLVPGSVRYKLPIEPALGGNRAQRNDNALAWFARDWREFELETT